MKKNFLVLLMIVSNSVLVPINMYSQINTASFAAKVDFTTGLVPNSLAIGDVDGDGKADLVVPNRNSNTLSVYQNTSTAGSVTAGSFATKVDFPTGIIPRQVAIGDLDGDSKPDLVLTNANVVSVYHNTSTVGSISASSFAPAINFTTGLQPVGVAIGDVDGNGKPELIVTNYSSNTISVFRNTSAVGSITAGSFAAKVDFVTGTNPISVAIGDIDGDTKPDLVVTNNNVNTVSVYHNTSTIGSITAASLAPKVDFAIGSRSAGGPITDLDGDGKPDFVATNSNSNNLSVLMNSSTPGFITAGSFAPKVDFTTGTNSFSVAVGDIDNDGKPDLAVSSTTGNTVSVYKNTSTPGSITLSSFATPVDFVTGNFPTQVVIGDVDGDGKLDLAVINRDDNTVSVYRNTICQQMSVSLVPDMYILYGALGYTGCKILTPSITGAPGPYAYSWISSDPAINGSAVASVTACNTNDVTHTYTVNVTAANGCSASAVVQLQFINIACSNNPNNIKVSICHRPPGDPGNCNTICVSQNAAVALLNNGSYPGVCLPDCEIPVQGRSAVGTINSEEDVEGLSIKVLSNPAKDAFIIYLNCNKQNDINIKVIDVSGRVIESRRKISPGLLRLGDNYAGGIYLLEIVQGDNRRVIKLVKQ